MPLPVLQMWTSWTTISGDKPYLEFLSREITSHLSQICKDLNFFTSEQLKEKKIDPFLRAMYLLHSGQPSNLFMQAMYESIGDLGPFDPENIDKGQYGMLCCLPVIPLDGNEAQKVKDLIYNVCAEHGLMPTATFNPMNDLYLEAVINLYFDRGDSRQVKKAHTCNVKLHEALYKEGYRFYRFDIETMKSFVDQESPFWRTANNIKKALDPQGIIAPKRYNLT